MAIGSNSILNGLASGITGNINKAYLLMRRPELNPSVNIAEESKNKLIDTMSSMQNKISKVGSRSLGVSGSAFNAVSIDKSLLKELSTSGYIPVQVQFNPSSISFQGNAGDIRRESVGGYGENQFQQYDSPSETIMAMDLYFDDVNNKDAFMMDGDSSIIGDLTTIGGITQRAEQGLSALRGKRYSVQDSTELLVAAMVQTYTRNVGFAWNKMLFWGELVGVHVQYTMFNKVGEPIRATVSIQIRQDQKFKENENDDDYKSEADWEKAFENMFKDKSGNNAMGIKNSAATNWMNGNFLNL